MQKAMAEREGARSGQGPCLARPDPPERSKRTSQHAARGTPPMTSRGFAKLRPRDTTRDANSTGMDDEISHNELEKWDKNQNGRSSTKNTASNYIARQRGAWSGSTLRLRHAQQQPRERREAPLVYRAGSFRRTCRLVQPGSAQRSNADLVCPEWLRANQKSHSRAHGRCRRRISAMYDRNLDGSITTRGGLVADESADWQLTTPSWQCPGWNETSKRRDARDRASGADRDDDSQ